MKLGIKLPYGDPLASGEDIRHFIVEADKKGFDSVWMGDHLVIPEVADRNNYSYLWRFTEEQLARPDMANLFPVKYFLEALTSCSFALGVSSRMEVGIGIIVVPMRNPVQLAAELATMDKLSGGKVIAGVGTGWMKEEFDALGVPFDDRGLRLDESIAAMRELWGSQPASYEGKTVSFHDVYCEPTPVRPGGPPIWVGGDSKIALRRTVRLGNGWMPVELAPEDFAAKSTELDQLLEEAGRDPKEVTRSVSTRLHLRDPKDGRALRAIEGYLKGGCDHLVMYCGRQVTFAENVDRMMTFYDLAREVSDGVSVAAQAGS